MSRLSGTATGAASGAAAGASLGPYGAAVGGVLGGIAGYFGSGDDDAAQRAQQAKVEADRKAAENYLNYRDVISNAYMKSAQTQNSFYDQNSNMLNSMNGGQGSPDIAGGVYSSPIQGEGMKRPEQYASTQQDFSGVPQPAGNAPQPLTFMPKGR
jgi:hypothetical protein